MCLSVPAAADSLAGDLNQPPTVFLTSWNVFLTQGPAHPLQGQDVTAFQPASRVADFSLGRISGLTLAGLASARAVATADDPTR
jgi:hypothetical protein